MLRKLIRRWKVSAVTVRLPLIDVTLQRDGNVADEPAAVAPQASVTQTTTIVEEQVIEQSASPAAAPDPLPVPVSNDVLRRIKAAAAQERLSGDRLRVMKTALADACLTVAQLSELVETLPLSEDRVNLVRLTRERLIDSENAYLLHRFFPISEDKQTVARLLRRD